MRERSEERKEQYKRIRSEFEDLEIEDKALFLLEATVATVARGVEQFGKGFADEIDKAFRRAARQKSEDAAEESAAETNGASAPEGTPAPNVSAEKKAKPPKDTEGGSEPAV